MARYIMKLLQDPTNIIFTNVQINSNAENLYIYKETLSETSTQELANWRVKETTKIHYWMLDVLKLIWEIDNKRRRNIETIIEWSGEDPHKVRSQFRNKRLKYYIFDDEAGIVFNQHTWKTFPQEFFEYLLQVRKINVYVVLAAQRFKNISMQLREHIDSVFYFRPFLWLNYFKNKFWQVRIKEVETDWSTSMRKYVARDDQGNNVVKEVPIDSMVERMWKPSRYKYYDDLYLNKKFDKSELKFNFDNVSLYIKNKVNGIFEQPLASLTNEPAWNTKNSSFSIKHFLSSNKTD